MVAAFVSSRIALCCDSSLVVSPLEPAPPPPGFDGVVAVVVGVLVSAAGVSAIFSEAFGVAAVSGIFGGFTAPDGSVALAFGVVVAAPGVLVGATAGVDAVGAGTCATVVVTTCGLLAPLLSAAIPAAAAPSTSTATAASATARRAPAGRAKAPRRAGAALQAPFLTWLHRRCALCAARPRSGRL